MKHKSLNQLLCAATVNARFREVLLRDPARAIATGYFDHDFSLTMEEQELVVGIQAQQLEDFAAQVYGWISSSGNTNGCSDSGHNGNGRGQRGDRRKPESLIPEDRFVDLYRAPRLAAHA